MRTVLAVVVAAALVGGALHLRSAVIAPDGGPLDGDVDTEQPVAAGGDLVVVCDVVLGDACPPGAQQLDLAALLDRFAADPVVVDALIAPVRVVELIEESRTSRAVLGEDRQPVATTPLVLATAVARDELVADACPTTTWTCLADLLAAGSLSPAITDPTETTQGLAAFAAMTGGFLGDPGYSTNALSGSGFIGWLDVVDDRVTSVADPLNDLILFGGARNDAAVVTEVRALDAVARAAGNVPDLHWPTPLAALPVTVVAVDDADADAVAELRRQAGELLRDAGWRPADGRAVADGTPALDAADDELPAGGVLFSLQGLWP